MGRRLKRLVKPPLAWVLAFRRRWSRRRVGLALCYHRVGHPAGDVEGELVPALDTRLFERHVQHLRRRYRVVPASELQRAVADRRRGQRIPVAVTFDDDLPSHVDEALPVLVRVGVPATFFLCGASLERPHRFWWERLQRAWDRGLVDEQLLGALGVRSTSAERPPIRTVAAAIQALPPDRRDLLAGELGERIGPDPDEAGLRAPSVASLARSGFEIGFHTLRHDALPRVDDELLERAMREGREQLADAAGAAIDLIAYPHGEANSRVADAARTAGFRYGFTGSGRAVTERDDPLLLSRRYPRRGSLADFAFNVARALSG